MRQDIPSRRRLLRGTLALGSSLCVPALFSGCDSRNTASTATPIPAPTPQPAPAPAPAPAAAPAPSAPATSNKVKKETVQYQEQPKGDQKCSLCMHFNAASNTCNLVEGPINPNGWCVLWTRKS